MRILLWIVSVAVGLGAIWTVLTAVTAWTHAAPEWTAAFDLIGLAGIIGSVILGGLIWKRLTNQA